MNPDPLPEITPHELAQWLAEKPALVLLDVREPSEARYAAIHDARVAHVPLSLLARQGSAALPDRAEPQAEVVVFCHVGERSAQVTAWLRELGFGQVYNLRGGIDAYARLVDPTIPIY